MDIGSDLYFHIRYLIQVVATRKYWESKLRIKTDNQDENQDENLPFIMHPHTNTQRIPKQWKNLYYALLCKGQLWFWELYVWVDWSRLSINFKSIQERFQSGEMWCWLIWQWNIFLLSTLLMLTIETKESLVGCLIINKSDFQVIFSGWQSNGALNEHLISIFEKFFMSFRIIDVLHDQKDFLQYFGWLSPLGLWGSSVLPHAQFFS